MKTFKEWSNPRQ